MSNKVQSNLLEKHYTPKFLQDEMWAYFEKYYNQKPTEWLENSAGDGALIDFLKTKYSDVETLAFDIHNESGREDIKECNYLKEKIEYKKGRVAFINPPFGPGIKFIEKALEESDYCVALTSATSLLNMKFEKYITPKVWLYKKGVFENCAQPIIIAGWKKI